MKHLVRYIHMYCSDKISAHCDALVNPYTPNIAYRLVYIFSQNLIVIVVVGVWKSHSAL